MTNDPLQQLANKARNFQGPQVDVTESVMKSIRDRSVVQPTEEASLMPYAIVAVLAASITLYFGMEAWTIINNPALEIVQSVESVLP